MAFNWVKPEGSLSRCGLEIRCEMPYPFIGMTFDPLWVRKRAGEDRRKSLQ
ncbi:MAG: hypothetical protein ACE5HJ_08095 [Thermoplasmata archaeon]